jgi:shikimate dehydrogenase
LTRVAVLGSPIAHSKSPALHRAAYAALGLDWRYDAVEVVAGGLGSFVEGLGDDWRGLSLTMPLKREVLPLLATIDSPSELTGGANTVVFEGERLHGFNTDVFGMVSALGAAGVGSLASVRILGGGATASSALVAAAQLGARTAVLGVRSPDRIGSLVAIAEQLDVELRVETLGAFETPAPELTISTLPNDVELATRITPAGMLFDVAYEPWPTPLAADWLAAGLPVVAGLEMLAWQALAQVRAFVNGSPHERLDGEASVFAAMRAAVGI